MHAHNIIGAYIINYIGQHLEQNYMEEHFPFTPEEAPLKDNESLSAVENIFCF